MENKNSRKEEKLRLKILKNRSTFEPDPLLKKILTENSAEVFEEGQCSSGFPESRRRNNNQAWYWRSDG